MKRLRKLLIWAVAHKLLLVGALGGWILLWFIFPGVVRTIVTVITVIGGIILLLLLGSLIALPFLGEKPGNGAKKAHRHRRPQKLPPVPEGASDERVANDAPADRPAPPAKTRSSSGTVLAWGVVLLGVLLAVWFVKDLFTTAPNSPARAPAMPPAQAERMAAPSASDSCRGSTGSGLRITVDAPVAPYTGAHAESSASNWKEVPVGGCRLKMNYPLPGPTTYLRACTNQADEFVLWTDPNGTDVSDGRCNKYHRIFIWAVGTASEPGLPDATPNNVKPQTLTVIFDLEPPWPT